MRVARRENVRRFRGESGQVGGIEVLPFGFLVFVAVTLLLANAWGVIDAKLAVTSSAREAVRAYVEADTASQAEVNAVTRAQETLVAYGRSGPRATVDRPIVNGGFSRCARVSVTVSYEIPTLSVPFIGGFGHLKPVTSTYSELVDPYRGGLLGPANCQ